MMHQADTVCQSMLHACDMDCSKVSPIDEPEIRERGNERRPAEEASRRGGHRLSHHRGGRPERRGADGRNVSNPRAKNCLP